MDADLTSEPRCASRRTRPRLLILGSGFAAFRLLKRIDLKAYDVTVISRRNHFLCTPLLPSTTVGTVEFRTIIEPIRRARSGTRFLCASAESVDLQRHSVHCRSLDGDHKWEQPYDLLVIAVGADANTFGIPGVREHACFLKELSDARVIRERVIGCLERAALPGLPEEERNRLLHFVSVGAGPTGVRFAAELHDLLVKDLRRSYPELASRVRITIVEAGKSILSAYDEGLRAYTAETFDRRRIGVRLECPVSEIGPGYLRLASGEVLDAAVILWAAGFAPLPLVTGLCLEKNRAGRILTDEFLRVPNHPEIVALGDCACPRDQNYPQLAQVAEQQGKYVADLLNGRAAGRPSQPFCWRNVGVSSYIGRGSAVAESGRGSRRAAGFLAYQMWRSAMFTQLVSPKNKILVPLDRLRAAVFGRELSKF
jgi:NADH:ubiquinone reductase (non-electrogenic)